jgi:hypothetical protein
MPTEQMGQTKLNGPLVTRLQEMAIFHHPPGGHSADQLHERNRIRIATVSGPVQRHARSCDRQLGAQRLPSLTAC